MNAMKQVNYSPSLGKQVEQSPHKEKVRVFCSCRIQEDDKGEWLSALSARSGSTKTVTVSPEPVFERNVLFTGMYILFTTLLVAHKSLIKTVYTVTILNPQKE